MRLADLFAYDVETEARRSGRPETYLFFAAAFTAILFLSHAGFLGVPYFWDEAGYYAPAALDLFEDGRWIPVTTTPNVHPPLVRTMLALTWHVTGVSIESARIVMLLIAGFSALGAFLLAIELCRPISGSPAFLAILFLIACPLFFTQAMLIQLDMPAMAFTTWALFLFLRGRMGLCVAACVLLVLTKETGALVPVVLGLWCIGEKRLRAAAWFALPAMVLFAWLLYLRLATGSWFGDAGFAEYNATYPLHPARLISAVIRRVTFLFVENFHWIGAIAIAAGVRLKLYQSRGWRLAAIFAVAHTLMVCLFGGAILDRYLLPVLPFFYTAVAAALSALPPQARLAAATALLAGLFVSLFWSPPFWPTPLDNNLAMVRFAEVHRQAAQFIETQVARKRIVTAWPMSIELKRPELGYVTNPVPLVEELPDFRNRLPADDGAPMAFVLFSRDRQPPLTIFREPLLKAFAERYLNMYTPIDGAVLQKTYGLRRTIRFESHGQWVEIYGR